MMRTTAVAVALSAVLMATTVSAERTEEIQAPRGQETVTPRHHEEIQAPRGQEDVQAPRGADAETRRR